MTDKKNLAFIRGLYRLSMLRARLSMSYWEVAAYSSCSSNNSFGIVGDGWWCAAKRISRISHMCAVVFRSGDLAGQSIRWISSLSTALLFNSHNTIRRSVFDHEEELKSPTTSKKANLGGGEPQYKGGTSDWRLLEDVKVNSANKHDTSQNENSTTSKYLSFDNVGRMFSCFLLCTHV